MQVRVVAPVEAVPEAKTGTLWSITNPTLLEGVDMLDEVDAPMPAEEGLELLQGSDRVVGAGQKTDVFRRRGQGGKGLQPGERGIDHGPFAPGNGDPAAAVQCACGRGGLAKGAVERNRETLISLQVQVQDDVMAGVEQAPGQPRAEYRMLVGEQQEGGTPRWSGRGQNQRPRFMSPSSTSCCQSWKRREALQWKAEDRSSACSA